MYRDGRYRATTFISEALARSCVFAKEYHLQLVPRSSSLNAARAELPAFGPDANAMRAVPQRCAKPERHTRHAANEASRCVSCHMPRIMEALLFQARSHGSTTFQTPR
jgi:hypothetical protein